MRGWAVTTTEFRSSNPRYELMIRFRCVRCHHSLKINAAAAGKKLYCPVCYFELTVPEESTIKPIDPSQLYAVDEKPIDVREMQHRREFVTLRCKVCSTNIAVRKEQIGEEVVCPDCETAMIVPPDVAQKLDDALGVTLDKIMLGLGDDSTKDTYAVRGENSAPLKDWTGYFPVHCQLCRTLMYAAEHQVGTELTCPDCDTKTEVPPNPRKVSAPPPTPVSFEGQTTFGVAKDKAAPTQPLIPVVCELCGTRMHAEQSLLGEYKACPDCGRRTLVRAVPKEELVQSAAPGEGYAIGMANAPARPPIRALTDYRYVEGSLVKENFGDKPPEERPVRRRPRTRKRVTAATINPDAPPQRRFRQVADSGFLPYKRPLPKHPLTEGLLVPILTWRVMVRVLISTGLACLAIFITFICPGLFIVVSMGFGGVLLLLWATLQTHYCWNVFLFSTDGNDDFSDWIDYSYIGALGLWFWMLCGSILAATPGYFFASFFPGEPFVTEVTPDGNTIWIDNAAVIARHYIFLRLSHWILFPIFFLSCMEAGSYFSPVSWGTLRTLARYTDVWIRFYALAALVILLPEIVLVGVFYLAVKFLGVVVLSVFYFPVGFFCINFASLLFFRLLGRCAWVLEEKVRWESDGDDDNDD